MKVKIDTIVTGVLVICALSITTLVARRELTSSPTSMLEEERRPLYVKEWQDGLDRGVRLGAADAPVQLIEFADFECPFCAEFGKTLKLLREKYPTQIGLTYVHFPIFGHRFAIPAARAAECAGEQGRFEAMHDELFEQQDQFGLKPWTDMAKKAAVPDIPAFETCVEKTAPISRVEEGKALGAKLDVKGTPTIIINGWKLGHPPTEAELDQMVRRILAGKSPVGST
jgi:protein-disulfide isomerase